MRDLLTEYVDGQTPDEAPPFEYVEQAARERRRRRYVVAAAIGAVVLITGATFGITRPSATPRPAGPTAATSAPNLLDDGPPPQQFKIGSTLLLLRGEIAVTSATQVPGSSSALVVQVGRDEVDVEPCVPNTIVRILSQDASSIRIAAYRYSVAPDQLEGHQCARRSVAPRAVRLDLRSPLAGRTVYAGSTGNRTILP